MSSDSDSDVDVESLDWDYSVNVPDKFSNLSQKFANRVNEANYNPVSSSITSSVRATERQIDENRHRIKDIDDRATVDLVLDGRTRVILYKLISTGKLSHIYGCVAAGKEANVYFAKDAAEQEFAVKIYKTSILVFKDRERYVAGEFRFRQGYSKHNPRKMVKVWAEKEMRNLKRLRIAHIPCPEPIMVKQNVLMMQFLGTDGKAAPRLKDVVFESNTEEFYKETVKLMRTMYQECRLVHADFSEYNLLYHKDQIHVIDVSQSVEHDHPHALEFLRRDCTNVNDFFKKNGSDVFSLQALFDFITDLTPMEIEVRYTRAKEQSLEVGGLQEGVFREVYIPRSLHDLQMEEDKSDQGLFFKLTGVVQPKAESSSDSQQSEEGESSEEEEGEDKEEEGEAHIKNKHGDVIYEGLTKQERKLKVKEDKRAKRKTKIPKKVKKHKVKLSSTKQLR
mmetsp:Transcript_7872/g.15227  ORF Transcript_7872/g.15227 Transcript_7872/m.15227 type:complete len:450 (+) Transcript_7872:3290-4639(+)